MKQFLFLIGLTLFTSTAAFAEANTTAKIHQGDWLIGGSTTLTKEFTGHPATYFNFNGSGQYFFKDGFAAGLEAGIALGGGAGTAYSVGPVVTKYFGVKDRIAPYVSFAPFTFNRLPWRRYLSSRMRTGVEFFLNDSISFGPALEYTHDWPTHTYRSANNLALLGMFSLHF